MRDWGNEGGKLKGGGTEGERLRERGKRKRMGGG
jgi:hypothetical protein